MLENSTQKLKLSHNQQQIQQQMQMGQAWRDPKNHALLHVREFNPKA